MIPSRFQHWFSLEKFPQRILFSGASVFPFALEIAEQLQNVPLSRIQQGVHTDTLYFPDSGKSFKIDFSEMAKKDDQSEFENVRGLLRWCSQKPVEARYRVVLLENIERMSHDAPHAFLKLLEEPPEYVVFLFTTRNHHQLLDTILSRFTLIRVPSSFDSREVSSEVRAFLSLSLFGQFVFLDRLQKEAKQKGEKMNRDVYFQFLEDLLFLCRQEEKYFSFLDVLFETYQAIDQNVNPRLALERMILHLHSLSLL